MKYCVFLVLFYVTIASEAVQAQTRNVTCEFIFHDFEPYTCIIRNENLSANDSIAIVGTHVGWRNNTMVDRVIFALSKLHHIPQEVLDAFPNLIELVAAFSNIQTLNPLRNCPKLAVVNLQFNNLTIIPPNVFKECSNMIVIELQDNQIVKFNSEGLENLQRINLNRNQLNATTPETFNHFQGLTRLWVRENRLQSINSEHFRMPNLRELDMSANNLTELTGDSFKHTPFLWDVSVGDNQIQKINETIFYDLQSLAHVSLRGNKISNIDRMFIKSTGMRTLSLANNRIVRVNRNTFGSMHQLQLVMLNINAIDVIEIGVFDGVSASANIMLADNICINQNGNRTQLQLALERCLPHN